MNFSYWEDQYYDFKDSIVVLGAGYTGLSTAISIKEKDPEAKVIVIDKYYPSHGASTKNAGFSCFGSVTEILDDLQNMSKEACVQLIQMRCKGIAKHLSRVGNSGAGYLKCGGYEVFQKSTFPSDKDIGIGNEIMDAALDLDSYFERTEQKYFADFDNEMIVQKEEGSINPVMLYKSLINMARDLGVEFLFGQNIESIDTFNKKIKNENGNVQPFKKLCVCLNGFAQKLIPELKVSIVRNQVLVTSEISNIDWQGVYHFDMGYYYFRRVGNRILLGGARNKDSEAETINQFGNTASIISELKRFLEVHILKGQKYSIDYKWSGLLGVGKDKYPIVKQIHQDVFVGVKLGGMGVALSGYIGSELAEMVI